MSTFVYSPGIKAQIGTARHGIIDVSEDIARGDITLGLGGSNGHQVVLTLTNERRKYDGVFTPNDRIVVHLKRIRWLQVFSGYLTAVPIVSVYSEDVTLRANCTVKRIKFSLYDSGAPATVNLLRTDGAEAMDSDSGLTSKVVSVLTEMVGWDFDKIHMGGIPLDWFKDIQGLYENLSDQFTIPDATGMVVGGESLISEGTIDVRGSDGEVERGPGYGTLPAHSGAVGTWGDPGQPHGASWSLYSGLSGAFQQVAPQVSWYCAMRWPGETVTGAAGATGSLTSAQQAAARAWWRNQKLLVINTATNKAVVVQPVHWGPPVEHNRAIDVSANALEAIGATTGTTVHIRFARKDAPVGPYTPTGGSTARNIADSQSLLSRPDALAGPGGGGGGLIGSMARGIVSAADAVRTDAILSHEGIVFARRADGAGWLEPNTAAAYDFIKQAWPDVLSIGGWGQRSGTSDHPLGLALDAMVSSGEPSPEQVALGNSIAYWFTQNPGVFGTKYVIWNNLSYNKDGWKVYRPNNYDVTQPTGGHRDHPHISFHDTKQTALGPRGEPWPVTPGDFMVTAAVGGVIHQNRAGAISSPGSLSGTGGPGQLIRAWNWAGAGDPLSFALTGPRRLLNDASVLPLVQSMMNSAMRDWCAAPNGDFIAWFPDYFNLYGTLSRLVVQTIELERFNVIWSDDRLITHQFVTGVGIGSGGLGSPSAQTHIAMRKMMTHGIATVEFPELLETLLNASQEDPASAGWLDGDAILQRFGARVNHTEAAWAASPQAEFWQAVHLFRKSWASQFSCTLRLGFMPELFPGMILQVPEYGIQFYVDQVTHNANLSPQGGGFTTKARVMAPSTIGAQGGLYGLPRGGSWVGADEQGPAFGPSTALPEPEPAPPRPPNNQQHPGGTSNAPLRPR
jgi:hypothetical protein